MIVHNRVRYLVVLASMTAVVALAVAGASLAATDLALGAHKAARSSRSSSCQGVAPHVIAADAVAQVFAARVREEREVFGCTYGHRRYRLGDVPECESVGGAGGCGGVANFALSGTLVAFGESFAGGGARAEWLIVVRDLRSGKTLRRVPTGTPPAGFRQIGAGVASDVVVKSDGAVAWLTSAAPFPKMEVHVSGRGGTRLLASGNEIQPNSLALAGNTLYWTEGGVPRSALLQ